MNKKTSNIEENLRKLQLEACIKKYQDTLTHIESYDQAKRDIFLEGWQHAINHQKMLDLMTTEEKIKYMKAQGLI